MNPTRIRLMVELFGWFILISWLLLVSSFIIAASLTRKRHCRRCGRPFLSPESDADLCPTCHRTLELLDGDREFTETAVSIKHSNPGGDAHCSSQLSPRFLQN